MSMARQKLPAVRLEQLCLQEIRKIAGLHATQSVAVKPMRSGEHSGRRPWTVADIEPDPGGVLTWQQALNAVLPLQGKYDLE
ncbi:hypothetical protein BA190_08920 [Labrys sp. WJW]|uniref:hypothetical protein n=2 Tax=Labrys TaxID=204476 RepID=UPI00082AA9A0|nr:hypothetical protein [Labrys sp. WJW]OCC05514.1 hypothetical protein BA190_08920 [Labrys sp. WJW]